MARQPAEQSETFDEYVEDIRIRYASNPFLLVHVEDLARRRLGLAPLTAPAAVLAGLSGIAIRLAAALLATALVGEWAGIPWGRWAVVIVLYGLFDATQPQRTPPLDVPMRRYARRVVEDRTALLSTMALESDLARLAQFHRRWLRMPVSAAVGVVVTATMLAAIWLFAPTGISELPVGSLVLLAFLLYDFGAGAVFSNLVDVLFMAREAEYDHHLFWVSPVDSPEVQSELRMMNFLSFGVGMWVTLWLVLSVVLVSWDSPLVPLAVGFIVIGTSPRSVRPSPSAVASTASSSGSSPAADDTATAHRDFRVPVRRSLPSGFGAAARTHRPPQHDPGCPHLAHQVHTLMHAAAGLIVPTILFVLTVFGEVYTERVFDALLPEPPL
ncbi:MAG TPA: hypothetical protein VLB85_10250 [Acidimicrobiia bacterium]|nr:hypothetical protein [Acidimicrobiia bacterium]